MQVVEGPLQLLKGTVSDPVDYTLIVGDSVPLQLPLNAGLGRGMEIRFLNTISCRHCGELTRKSYGGGYCYGCFKRLARCDLCVVSPDRCHYHQGTCREPAWGEAFCMAPHVVYLANATGAKVGITRAGHEARRWIDQGATQALAILAAPTRRHAGIAEVGLAAFVADRSDWRRLVTAAPASVDLPSLRDRLRGQAAGLPAGVSWIDADPVAFSYPVAGYCRQAVRLDLQTQPLIRGNLIGIRGQYLLFEHGALNVRRHVSYHVRVTLLDEAVPVPAGESNQLELFP